MTGFLIMDPQGDSKTQSCAVWEDLSPGPAHRAPSSIVPVTNRDVMSV